MTVYRPPVVDFSSLPAIGCVPLPVSFTANASPGDGTIANYFWDFGDGNTQQGQTLQQVTHTYNFSQYATAGLTVLNSYGCYTTIQKPVANILKAIQASFTVDKTVLCRISDPVTFTNTSTGPGLLSYLWDFGDGTTSTAVNPVHVYNKRGTYTISLTVSNAEGCSNTFAQSNFINSDNFNVDFSAPASICQNAGMLFTDLSTTGASSELWLVDNQIQCYYCNTGSFSYTFADTLPHTVELIGTYGTCMDTAIKQVTAKGMPMIKPFQDSVPVFCNSPQTVQFKDTTPGAVSWAWFLEGYSNQVVSTLQAPILNFGEAYSYWVSLTVTNAAGCSATESQYINVIPVTVGIIVINTNTTYACDSVPVQFGTNASDSITSYHWDFADGSTSTAAQPQHTFRQGGDFIISLTYTTVHGCSGTVQYDRVHVSKRYAANITVYPDSVVCGNNPLTFYLSSASSYNQWNFGDGTGDFGEFNTTVTHQYTRDSTYTITAIYSDYYYGLCPDTVTKKVFIKVLPPFAHISQVQNTCDGNRGLVTFQDSSYKALSWDWNFGDGTPDFISNSSQTVHHQYAQTGSYKVVLSNTNGQCTVRDSAFVYVLLKQQPILAANESSTCANSPVNLTISNFQSNPVPFYLNYGEYYSLFEMQYGDSTNWTYNGSFNLNSVWQNTASIAVQGLDPSKKDLRIISTSAYFGCHDTTNFIPLQINGPTAGFEFVENSPCYAYPVILKDTSLAGKATPIVSWLWSFGDGSSDTQKHGGVEYHTYNQPGGYMVFLTVTDANGCISTTSSNYSELANPSGPKAGFSYYPANVTPNSPVVFSNFSNTFNAYYTQYTWLFGDGTSSTDYSPTHSYNSTATDTVMLIAYNPVTQCRDTSIQIIHVKIINTAFSFIKNYISTNNCPPVIVSFTNTSSNALSVSWDFGDGSTADNENNPSHTYYKAGVYKITMYGYGYNGTTDKTVDSVIVKAPSANLNADKLSGCLSQTVTLNAQISNAASFIWDFADGTITQTKDSFAVHAYLTPGLYDPALILVDSGGCTANVKLGDTIVIDTLQVTLPKYANPLCDSALLSFHPILVSLAADSMHRSLSYRWNFGTGNPGDTSNIGNPVFDYTIPGKYLVQVVVQSPFGCVKQASDTVVIVQRSKASIAGPAEICAGTSALFTGSGSLTIPGLSWNWDFNNGMMAQIQNPPAVSYVDSGIYNLSLVLVNKGCADTAHANLWVHPVPVIHATPQQAILCLGNALPLFAGGGLQYSWSPATGLNNPSVANPLASPLVSTLYTVKVTNVFRCIQTDSSQITVVAPFNMKVPSDTFLCVGKSVQLYAIGANSYNWINNTNGLSATQISNPVATPTAPVSYTVVGYDAYHCFTDTATIRVGVEPLPTVNHEPDVETLTGSSVPLNATGSPDIISWNWTPPDYLSCADCPSPVSNPRSNITYIVTGENKYGCVATDTIVIKLVCSENRVYVPTAFTPNHDGNNDVFYIMGRGVRVINSLRIYGRWGELVFEKHNVTIGDRSAGWDGTINGVQASTATYVYLAELTCDTGEPFVLKGTVVLIR